jgi:hypothetical protein
VSPSMFDRRRSDRFAELLEEAGGRRRRHRRTDVDPEVSELVGLVGRVQELPVPAPTEDFRDNLRAMLLATIERDGIGVTATEKEAQNAAREALAGKTKPVRQVQATGGGRARAAVLIGVTAGALVLSGVSLASTDSLPGDPLYQVKRSSEQAQLALAGSDASKGQLHLEYARSRLSEAGQVDADRIATVLADMDTETTSAVVLLFNAAMNHQDTSSVDSVRQFVADQRSALTQLSTTSPAAAQAVQASLALLDRIQIRIAQVQTALSTGCKSVTMDGLGPSPAC